MRGSSNMIEAACGLTLSKLCFSQVHKKDLTLLASMSCPLGHPFHTVPVYDAPTCAIHPNLQVEPVKQRTHTHAHTHTRTRTHTHTHTHDREEASSPPTPTHSHIKTLTRASLRALLRLWRAWLCGFCSRRNLHPWRGQRAPLLALRALCGESRY